MPSESFEIDMEKLEKIIEESFSKDKSGKPTLRWSITPYKADGQLLIDIVCDDWLGVNLSELNKFATNLCSEGIIKRSSEDFWIFDALRKKSDYGSLGIMIDVSNTWYRSLRPRPKTKTTIELKPEHEPVIFVDKEGLGINKKERKRQIIMERQLKKEG